MSVQKFDRFTHKFLKFFNVIKTKIDPLQENNDLVKIVAPDSSFPGLNAISISTKIEGI